MGCKMFDPMHGRKRDECHNEWKQRDCDDKKWDRKDCDWGHKEHENKKQHCW